MDASAPPEVRLDRMRPAEIDDAMARAPVAWIPLGALEFHAAHLPFGTDGFTGQGLLERAAAQVGGVVLPWTYLTIGTLHFPWTFRYDPALVAATVLATIRQTAAFGARVVVVHTGHAPLDLVHLLKRTCAEAEAEVGGGFRAYGLTYLELNAALGTGLGTDWPVAVDHGSRMETSWMLAIEPDLVALDRLPDPNSSDAPIVGVYGPNPRDVSVELGWAQVDAAAALLADRARDLVAGRPLDTMADLRGFVERYWPEPLRLGAVAGPAGIGGPTLTNDGPVSRYLTAVRLAVDGVAVPPEQIDLVNPTPGEPPRPVAGASLGPESGFYVRRAQTAELRLRDGLAPGRHRLELTVGFAGVSEATFAADVAADVQTGPA